MRSAERLIGRLCSPRLRLPLGMRVFHDLPKHKASRQQEYETNQQVADLEPRFSRCRSFFPIVPNPLPPPASPLRRLDQLEGIQEHAGFLPAVADAVEVRHSAVITCDSLAIDDAGPRGVISRRSRRSRESDKLDHCRAGYRAARDRHPCEQPLGSRRA